MRIVSFTEAHHGLKDVLDGVVDDAEPAVITRRHGSDAVVMSLDAYNSLLETIYLLRSSVNSAHLNRSIRQYRAAKATRFPT